MVFLKVIPTSLLFIHGSAGHCNLETSMCVCDEFYKKGKKMERAIEAKSEEAEKRKKWGRMEGGREMRFAVWNAGLDFCP